MRDNRVRVLLVIVGVGNAVVGFWAALAPHSFFDRSFAEHKAECGDAWRRVLGFVKTGDPANSS